MCRRALTLVELLVVLVIITLVTAAAIPMMAPQGASRRQREAARMVASFLQGARSRAIETGRPVGVMFEWFPPGSATPLPLVMNLSYAIMHRPYSGEISNALAQIKNVSINDAQRLVQFRLNMTPNASFNPGLVRVNDQIRFNYQGFTWTIVGPDSTGSGGAPDGVVDLQPGEPQLVDVQMVFSASEYATRKVIALNLNNQTLPYQVLRQPVRSSSGQVQLPDGAVIDMPVSGFAGTSNAGRFGLPDNFKVPVSPVPARPTDFMMSFAPNGSIDHIYGANWAGSFSTRGWQRVTEPLYLMIGKREKVRTLSTSTTPKDMPEIKYQADTLDKKTNDHNWTDPDNFWVVVNPSGTIVTGEVAQPTAGLMHFGIDFPQSRKIARTGENVGGR